MMAKKYRAEAKRLRELCQELFLELAHASYCEVGDIGIRGLRGSHWIFCPRCKGVGFGWSDHKSDCQFVDAIRKAEKELGIPVQEEDGGPVVFMSDDEYMAWETTG